MQLNTYWKAFRMPVGSKSRKAALQKAKQEMLAAGFELRHNCGDGIYGWGRYWYTSSNYDAVRIGDRPNLTALEAIIEAKARGLLK